MESLTATYESAEFDSISFYLPSFGNPLWEEKSTEIISSLLEVEHRLKDEGEEDEPLFGSHLKEAKEAIKSIFNKQN